MKDSQGLVTMRQKSHRRGTEVGRESRAAERAGNKGEHTGTRDEGLDQTQSDTAAFSSLHG